jgi:eukaryotic-like serine/threonine-protein kinase
MPEWLGRYELLAPLAQGGTAEVFLARLVGAGGFEKVVVLKRLLEHLADDREYVDMFLDEARLGARLDQSNIVQTIELGCVDGHYFIAMEYLQGLSLHHVGKQALRRAGGLPPELTLALAVQACTGLHYAHEATQADGTPLRLVHRDISPQNLIVTYEGVLKIVDFGIAHAAAEARDARTRVGFIKGKFAYMSPEQCLGKPFDRRCDVFALAIVVHELLTGKRLFRRANDYDTYQAIVSGAVPRPSQLNPRLDAAIDAVLLKALATRPEQRYLSAEAFGEDLQALLHRMGKHGSSGEIARYLEQHFQPEIAAQERLLRELLSADGPTDTTHRFLRWGQAKDDDEEIEELSAAELIEASLGSATPIVPEPNAPRLVDVGTDDKTAALRSGGAVQVIMSGPAAVTLPARRPDPPASKLARATPPPQLLAEGTRPLPQAPHPPAPAPPARPRWPLVLATVAIVSLGLLLAYLVRAL